MYNQEPFFDNNLVNPPPIYPHGIRRPDPNFQGPIAQNQGLNYHNQWYHYSPYNQGQTPASEQFGPFGGYPGFYRSYEPFLAQELEEPGTQGPSTAPLVVQEVQEPNQAVDSSQNPQNSSTLKAKKPRFRKPLRPMNPYKTNGQPDLYKYGLVSSDALNLPLNNGEKIITQNLAKRITYEIQSRKLSQKVFADQVIGKTQGYLSNLLYYPGDWMKLLPAGKETWRQLLNWVNLCETDKSAVLHGIPLVCCDFQRPMSDLVKVSEPLEQAVKRQRTNYTKEQKKQFMEYFEKNRYPNQQESEQIAAEMGLKVEQVKYYFTGLRRNR